MGQTVQNSLVYNLIVRYKFSSGNWKKSRLSLNMAKEFLLIFVGKILKISHLSNFQITHPPHLFFFFFLSSDGKDLKICLSKVS